MGSSAVAKRKKRVYTLYHYILIGVAFLSSGHVYSVTKGNLCNYILFATLLLMLIGKVLRGIRKKKMNPKSIGIFAFIVLALIFDAAMNILFAYNFLYSIRFFSVLMFSLVFTDEMSFEEFKDIYIKCMTLISSVALVGFVIGSFSNFYYDLPTILNVNGVSYYDAIVFFAMNDFSRGRNIGVFWEPGIFAIFIALAVLFLIFDKKKLNKLQTAVLMLTLFSTLSTTGYFLIMIIVFAYVYTRKNKTAAKIVFTFAVLFLAIFSIFNYNTVFNVLLRAFPRAFSKLIDKSASTTARINAIKYNLEIFLQSPLWGSGLIKTNILFSKMTNGSQTSTMTLYFAQFGFIGIFYMIIHFISVIRYKKWTKLMCILFCLAWAILLNVEIVTFFPLIYIISFYFIEERPKTTQKSGDLFDKC